MFDFLKHKSLRVKQEAVPMQWSKDLPTKTGNYLCAYQYNGEWNYMERKIFESNGKLFYIFFLMKCCLLLSLRMVTLTS